MGTWVLTARELARSPEMVLRVAPPVVPLGMRVVLYPVMRAHFNGGLPLPAVSGCWDFHYLADSAFYSYHGLLPEPSAYPTDPNYVHYSANLDWIGSVPPRRIAQHAFSAMALGDLHYKLPYTGSGLGFTMVFATADGSDGIGWQDVNGNVALCQPVLVLKDNANIVLDTLVAGITVEEVSHTGTHVTMRVTRSHYAPASIELSSIGILMFWNGLTAPGLTSGPDPDDPGNVHKVYVTAPAGVWKFGVTSFYQIGVTNYPKSLVECVVEVS